VNTYASKKDGKKFVERRMLPLILTRQEVTTKEIKWQLTDRIHQDEQKNAFDLGTQCGGGAREELLRKIEKESSG
jgi:hypothetical protein